MTFSCLDPVSKPRFGFSLRYIIIHGERKLMKVHPYLFFVVKITVYTSYSFVEAIIY